MSQGNQELLTATVAGVIIGAATMDTLTGVATAAPVYIANYKTVESDGKWVGKESVKVGKSIGHACKKSLPRLVSREAAVGHAVSSIFHRRW